MIVKYACAIKQEKQEIHFLNEKTFKIVHLPQVLKIDKDR